MPRPVCGNCQREMTLERAVTVQFNAISIDGPYEQYQGDEAVCPGCGIRIVFRYGGQPCWRHFEGEEKRDKDLAYIVQERRHETGTIFDKTPAPTEGMFIKPMGAPPSCAVCKDTGSYVVDAVGDDPERVTCRCVDKLLVKAFIADMRDGANVEALRRTLRQPASLAALAEAERLSKVVV